MKTKVALFAVLCLLQLSACSTAKDPQFTRLEEPRGDEALVYIYRMHNFALRNSYPHVYSNGKLQGPLKDSAYLILRMQEGRTIIEIKGDSADAAGLG
jgi:hypothetical protein